MPYFDENPLSKLALQGDAAEAELDLRGLPANEALSQVESLLQATQARQPSSVRIRFDPARGDGRETLFLPLGRRLLEARKAGLLRSCLPTPDGDGYLIMFRTEQRASD